MTTQFHPIWKVGLKQAENPLLAVREPTAGLRRSVSSGRSGFQKAMASSTFPMEWSKDSMRKPGMGTPGLTVDSTVWRPPF